MIPGGMRITTSIRLPSFACISWLFIFEHENYKHRNGEREPSDSLTNASAAKVFDMREVGSPTAVSILVARWELEHSFHIVFARLQVQLENGLRIFR